MKYLAILPLLFAGVLNAQTTFKSLQQFENRSLDFKINNLSSEYLGSFEVNLPKESLINQNLQSDVRLFSLQQFNLGNYPMNDLSRTDFIMGTTLSNTLQLGRRSIQTTYLFDISGNLEATQTSFTFGKDKK